MNVQLPDQEGTPPQPSTRKGLARYKKQLGDSVLLVTVAYLATTFGMTVPATYAMLRNLKIPIVHIGEEAYFNFYMLELVFYYLTQLGGQGYAAPGSRFKATQKQTREVNHGIALEMTQEDLKKLVDPLLVAQMFATGPRARMRDASTRTLLSELRRNHAKQKSSSYDEEGVDGSDGGEGGSEQSDCGADGSTSKVRETQRGHERVRARRVQSRRGTGDSGGSGSERDLGIDTSEGLETDDGASNGPAQKRRNSGRGVKVSSSRRRGARKTNKNRRR